MNKILLLLALLFALSGCSVFGDKVGKVVDDYCKAPDYMRSVLRAEVNEQIAPNAIMIFCEGDKLDDMEGKVKPPINKLKQIIKPRSPQSRYAKQIKY